MNYWSSKAVELYQSAGDFFSARQIGMIKALAKAIDANDNYTGKHSEHVAVLMAELGRSLDFSVEETSLAYFAGLVHDIGKIGVPESILKKPARLTEMEFAYIKRHPDVGADILGEIAGFEKIAEAIRYHHERYDGRGYPHALKGDNIPILSRMLTLCDAYDAMTTTRCYRSPVSKEAALKEIKELSGIQFDPVISGNFLEMIQSQQ